MRYIWLEINDSSSTLFFHYMSRPWKKNIFMFFSDLECLSYAKLRVNNRMARSQTSSQLLPLIIRRSLYENLIKFCSSFRPSTVLPYSWVLLTNTAGTARTLPTTRDPVSSGVFSGLEENFDENSFVLRIWLIFTAERMSMTSHFSGNDSSLSSFWGGICSWAEVVPVTFLHILRGFNCRNGLSQFWQFLVVW